MKKSYSKTGNLYDPPPVENEDDTFMVGALDGNVELAAKMWRRFLK